MSAVDVSVVVLTMYSIEITMYSAMATYMIVSVVRNHLAHRPIRWLLLSLAVLFAAQVPDLAIRSYARVMRIMTGAPQSADGTWWLLGSITNMLAVVVFYIAFRLAQPSLRTGDDDS